MLVNTIVYLNLLALNTYYPINKINNSSNIVLGNKIIQYNKCIFYNNSCTYPINDIYNNLNKYNNIYEDDFDIPLSNVIAKIQELDYNSISSENKMVIDANKLGEIFLIGTPISKNRCRLFIFNNIPEYKKTTLYIKLKLMVNKINVFKS